MSKRKIHSAPWAYEGRPKNKNEVSNDQIKDSLAEYYERTGKKSQFGKQP
jgi:hypothetical protein